MNEQFPTMRGDARVARGASYFEVPLFSFIKKIGGWGYLSTGFSPSELYRMGERPEEWLLDHHGHARFDKILNLYVWGEYPIPVETERIDIEMYDTEEGEPNREQVDELAYWVKKQLDDGYETLVHCQAGLNRSSLVAARTLMLYGMTADESISLIRKQRSPMCLCNETFERWLRSL